MSIKEQVEQRLKAVKKKREAFLKDEIDSDFVMKCLANNVAGDAEIFKTLYSNDFCFNKSSGYWLYWTGSHWVEDKMDFALASVAGVATVYANEMNRLSKKIRELEDDDPAEKTIAAKRKSLKNRIFALKDVPRCLRVLIFAHTSKNALAIIGDQIDQKPWLLACKNGVINLKTGELETGRQKNYLVKASPVEWAGIDAPCEVWENALQEIFSGNQNLIDFFQRVCGYSLIGAVIESIMVVMTGRGRNGKSLIIETIS
ncbi:MAG: DNA primase, partial [Desulfobacteraceae bacterium]|nr:DNA primase [Desulfobacteraceae bacterium]